MRSPDSPTPPRATPGSPPRRVRLTAEARRQQILDAALHEFSALGFEGATMDRIAQRTGLTKAGLYAHFKSKEQVLEALLVSRLFDPSLPAQWECVAGDSLPETVDRYLAQVYRLVEDPTVQATFRLLITESGRAPERVHRWSQDILVPRAAQMQAAVDEGVARGLMPASTLSRKFALASAPTLLAMVTIWLLGAEAAAGEVQAIRAWHREMLLTMLGREAAP